MYEKGSLYYYPASLDTQVIAGENFSARVKLFLVYRKKQKVS